MGIAKIVFFDTLNKIRVFEKEIDISNNDWTKIEFEIPALPDYYALNFAITYKGTGIVYFDEVSLMPTNNFYGMRAEWFELFRKWKPSVLRYPGGSFVDYYPVKWEYMIGHIDQRKSAIYEEDGKHHQYTQRCDFGLDEYFKICELLDIEPYLVVNILRPIEEAVDMLNYCNGDTNTIWGKKRADNGHPEPYNVKFWETGNELYFNPIQEYADIINDISSAMKAVDSSIIIIANGDIYTNKYYKEFIPIIAKNIDVYGYHFVGGYDSKKITDSERTYLQVLANNASNSYISECKQYLNTNYPNIKLAADEWWSGYAAISNDDWLGWLLDTNIRNSSLESGLWNALQYKSFMAHPQSITFAARTIGIGLFRRAINSQGRKILYTTPAFECISMLSKHRGNYLVLNTLENCASYSDFEHYPPFWIPKTPYLDVTTTISEDTLFIAVVNRHPHNDIITNIEIDNTTIDTNINVNQLTSNNYLDYNDADSPNNIKATTNNLNITLMNKDNKSTFNYTFPKHSLTILSIPGTYNNMPDYPNSSFIVYPHPMSNSDHSLSISFNSAKNFKNIELYDVIGRLVYSVHYDFYSNNITINHLNIEKGCYQLIIETLEGTYTANIIKN
jgi:alpha-L-arabinofuranosidase